MGFMSLAEGVKLYMMSSPAEMTGPIAGIPADPVVDSIMRLSAPGDSGKRD